MSVVWLRWMWFSTLDHASCLCSKIVSCYISVLLYNTAGEWLLGITVYPDIHKQGIFKRKLTGRERMDGPILALEREIWLCFLLLKPSLAPPSKFCPVSPTLSNRLKIDMFSLITAKSRCRDFIDYLKKNKRQSINTNKSCETNYPLSAAVRMTLLQLPDLLTVPT